MLGVKANVKSLVVRIQTATTATLKQPPGTSLDNDASSDLATDIVALHDRVARQVEGVSETYATFFVFVEFTLVLIVLSFGSADLCSSIADVDDDLIALVFEGLCGDTGDFSADYGSRAHIKRTIQQLQYDKSFATNDSES